MGYWSNSHGPGKLQYDAGYDGSALVELIPHYSAAPAVSITSAPPVSLRTSGTSTRSDVKLGECYFYPEKPSKFYYCIDTLPAGFPSNDGRTGWFQGDHWATKSTTPVTFIPRWDSVAPVEKTVAKTENKWPHKCYGCGGPAYLGSRCFCKASCRPEYVDG